jgi:hypothetical protein
LKTKPLAVVVGFVAKSPVAGMAMYNFHYIAGLLELGYDVHYVERHNGPDECYDAGSDTFGDDPSYGLEFIRNAHASMPAIATPWTVIDRKREYHGTTRAELCEALDRADFVLTLADPTWFDDLERCDRRVFLDGDPMFTQVKMLDPENEMAVAVSHYDTLFTYWTRQGAPDTKVPDAGRSWISTTPVVATSLWEVASPRRNVPVTTVMNWTGFKDVTYDGRTYGKKDREVRRFLNLPSLTQHEIVLALGGAPPREQLRKNGWTMINPLSVTGSIEDYREFIANSFADLGIAKHAYVASRSGWISDRCLCYLASGRPVVHQDTGFTDWLPSGDGLLSFTTAAEAAECLSIIDRDHARHAAAARTLAEERFEARSVIGQMLDAAKLR